MKREIIITNDGSTTIRIPEWDENYHSTHGAIQEAKHVFIKNGLEVFQNQAEISILEIGFGTGLNALFTDSKKVMKHRSESIGDFAKFFVASLVLSERCFITFIILDFNSELLSKSFKS